MAAGSCQCRWDWAQRRGGNKGRALPPPLRSRLLCWAASEAQRAAVGVAGTGASVPAGAGTLSGATAAAPNIEGRSGSLMPASWGEQQAMSLSVMTLSSGGAGTEPRRICVEERKMGFFGAHALVNGSRQYPFNRHGSHLRLIGCATDGTACAPPPCPLTSAGLAVPQHLSFCGRRARGQPWRCGHAAQQRRPRLLCASQAISPRSRRSRFWCPASRPDGYRPRSSSAAGRGRSAPSPLPRRQCSSSTLQPCRVLNGCTRPSSSRVSSALQVG